MLKAIGFAILGFVGLSCSGAEVWQLKEWTVDGVRREALVHVPETKEGIRMPVVFAFHGHGGNMRNSTRSFRMNEVWPEALVVCMQGLPTPGQLTDPEGKKNGWQSSAGSMGDRDLKFFDAVFATVKSEHEVDEDRVYAMGHSNGGGFTYLLWAERGDLFAAMGPSSSAGRKALASLKPKPVIHVAGEGDPLVKYSWQKAMIEALRVLNQCGDGVAWDQDANCTLYPSSIGAPVVTAIHPGGHEYPKKAPEVIAKFFKQHRRLKEAPTTGSGAKSGN
jgi:polyhydroxybutyrate depolymerase